MYVCDQIWPSEELKRGFFLGVIVLTCYTVPLLLITVFYTLIACKVWNRDAPGFNSANSSQVRESPDAAAAAGLAKMRRHASVLTIFIYSLIFHNSGRCSPLPCHVTL